MTIRRIGVRGDSWQRQLRHVSAFDLRLDLNVLNENDGKFFRFRSKSMREKMRLVRGKIMQTYDLTSACCSDVVAVMGHVGTGPLRPFCLWNFDGGWLVCGHPNWWDLESVQSTYIETQSQIRYTFHDRKSKKILFNRQLTLCESSACCWVNPDTLSTSAVLRNELSERWWTLTSPW